MNRINKNKNINTNNIINIIIKDNNNNSDNNINNSDNNNNNNGHNKLLCPYCGGEHINRNSYKYIIDKDTYVETVKSHSVMAIIE